MLEVSVDNPATIALWELVLVLVKVKVLAECCASFRSFESIVVVSGQFGERDGVTRYA